MRGSGGALGVGRWGRERRTVRCAARLLTLFGMLAGLSPPNAYSQAPARAKNVLVLYTSSAQSPTNVAIDRGFLSVLRSEHALKVEYYTEYLEADRFQGERQLQLLRDYLQQKYEALLIDVVVASASAAHAFLLAHRQTLFPNAPLIFLAGSHLYQAAMNGPGSTGIGAYRDFR